ncbi:hypothetical protein ABZ135_25200 [Streptomyces sp. NPDC006339]|uniref:hypothetical protein n=1 Tax=Streptomyces sp. NPDC006339 TaxID=3156755 RepID=UPI0033A9A571
MDRTDRADRADGAGRADGRGSGKDVVLVFFFGDRDIGNTYVMRRAAPGQPPSGTLR